MAEGYPPYYNYPALRAMGMISARQGYTLQNEQNYSSDFRDFIAKCLQREQSLRPSAEELLFHPFIRNAKGKEVLDDLIKVSREIDFLESIFASDDSVSNVTPSSDNETSETSSPDVTADGTFVQNSNGTFMVCGDIDPEAITNQDGTFVVRKSSNSSDIIEDLTKKFKGNVVIDGTFIAKDIDNNVTPPFANTS